MAKVDKTGHQKLQQKKAERRHERRSKGQNAILVPALVQMPGTQNRHVEAVRTEPPQRGNAESKRSGKSHMKDFLLDYSYQVLTLVLIALAIGCIFLFITKGYWRGVLWSGFALICCMEAMLCLIAQHHYPTFLGPFASDVNTITNYTVRINIVDRQQMPVEDASVWSSIGEVRKMDHGWELSIPVMSLPPDKKKLTITATKESPPLSGQVVVELHDTANIATTIELAKDVSSDIHGLVVDKDEKPISDAKVIVQGYGGNPAHTNSRGEFRFPPSWGRNEQVFLTVEKEGYKSVTEIPQMAGDEPAYVILTRR